jgi:hypothetical protein
MLVGGRCTMPVSASRFVPSVRHDWRPILERHCLHWCGPIRRPLDARELEAS